jgi:hypothetical protein
VVHRLVVPRDGMVGAHDDLAGPHFRGEVAERLRGGPELRILGAAGGRQAEATLTVSAGWCGGGARRTCP